jgi:hypothetical protein
MLNCLPVALLEVIMEVGMPLVSCNCTAATSPPLDPEMQKGLQAPLSTVFVLIPTAQPLCKCCETPQLGAAEWPRWLWILSMLAGSEERHMVL